MLVDSAVVFELALHFGACVHMEIGAGSEATHR